MRAVVNRAEGGELALAESSDSPEAIRRGFQAFAADLMVQNSRRMAGFCAAVALVWWPLDYWVFEGQPETIEAYAWMRGGTAAVNAGVYLWLTYGTPPAAYRALTFTVAVALELAFASYTVATGGGAGTAFFSFFYLAPFLSLVLVTPAPQRLLASQVFVAAVCAGTLLQRPESIHEPAAAAQISVMVFAGFVAAITGHFHFRTMYSSFAAEFRLRIRDRELQSLADTLSQRVEEQTAELRELAAHVESARETERQWVAQELHDGLGQQLAAMRLAVDFGRRTVPDGRGQEVLLEVNELLDRTHETIRRILGAMRPLILDELGLAPSLQWLVSDVCERAGVEYAADVTTPGHPLPKDDATALFRAAQEALTNAVRHAEPSVIRLRFGRANGHWVLQVDDDGQGIEGPLPSGGLGISGVRERAARRGGTAAWETSELGGTRVRVRIPYRTPEQIAERHSHD